jgi:acyl-CoA thioesterase-1
MFATVIAAIRVCVSITLLCLIAQNAYAADARDDVILVVGDSLSAGYGIDIIASWPSLLQRRLDNEGYSYRVENASISGDTSRGGRTRLPRLLEYHRPQQVVLELGANDGLRGVPISELERNLRAMIEISIEQGAGVVLLQMRVPPNYGPRYAERFEQLYIDLEQAYDLSLVPFFLHNVVLDGALMQNDGLHPNAAAQPKMLENVWVYLRDQLH